MIAGLALGGSPTTNLLPMFQIDKASIFALKQYM